MLRTGKRASVIFMFLLGLCMTNSAFGVSLDTSGSYHWPVFCNYCSSVETDFSGEYNKYVLSGTCKPGTEDISGSYIINTAFSYLNNEASEVIKFVASNGVTYKSETIAQCTDDPWLVAAATCQCTSRAGNAYELLPHECLISKILINDAQRAAFVQEREAYFSTPPEAPRNLEAKASLVKLEVTLTWEDMSTKEDGFHIERYKQYKQSGNALYPDTSFYVDKNMTSHIDKDLVAETCYVYKIRSHFNKLFSEYAPRASATTAFQTMEREGLPEIILKAPSHLTSELDVNNCIALHWEDNSEAEEGYQLEQKTAGSVFALIVTLPSDTQSHTICKTVPGTTYTFRVRAYQGSQFSDYSNETSITISGEINPRSFSTGQQTLSTGTQGGKGNQLKAPLKLKAKTISGNSIKLTWKDVSDAEQGFVIERKKEGESFIVLQKIGQDVQEFIDHNVTAKTVYYYRVKAFNAVVESPYSKEVKIQIGEKGKAKVKGTQKT
ncbi:fibronectin type III domain-containing protein [bacterium]|nr:fibronectin type III domain-containing protein [bacterium]